MSAPQTFTAFHTRGGADAIVHFLPHLPSPWKRCGYLVHPGRGYEPALWTHEGAFCESREPHPHDLQHNLGEVTVVGPIHLHL